MYRLLLIVTLVLGGSVGFSQELPPERIALERQWLKQSAFCNCLYSVYMEYDSAWLTDGTASGLLDVGSYALDVYPLISVYAKAYAERTYADDGSPYSGPGGEKLGIKKCLDFYNSAALDSFVAELDSEFNYESALRNYLSMLKNLEMRRKADSVKSQE